MNRKDLQEEKTVYLVETDEDYERPLYTRDKIKVDRMSLYDLIN